MSKKPLVLGATLAGMAAAAVGAYVATHPKDARTPAWGGTRPSDDLLDLPDGISERDLPTHDGGSIHLIEKGQGRPLVLLHGITLRSDVWAPQFHELADRYRVIAVDLRGHGRSTAGSDGYGIPRLARDLKTVLEGLDLRDAVVVGHSMGGMTLMQFCGDFPDVLDERVAGCVFVATRAHQVFPPYVKRAVTGLVERGEARLERGLDLPGGTEGNDRVTRLAFGDRPSKKAISIVTEMGRSMEPAAFLPSARGLADHDAREGLRRTQTPTLVIVGTRDLLTPVPAGRHLAHLLPNSELVVLPRSGHQVMQERPDELAELLDGFVARIEGEQPSVAHAVADDPRPVGADQVEAGGDDVPQPADADA